MSFASLKGQVAIITGASRGIGRECAITLAKAGCNIVIAAKTDKETPQLPGTVYTVAKEVEALGVSALPVVCDVRKDDDLKRTVNETIAKFGRVDILVNNAGALWWKPVTDTPMDRYDLINGINSRASFALASFCLPHMIKQHHGHIINMSPPIDLHMLKNKTAYCISKFGMTLGALGIAQEMQGKGVSANSLWPVTMVESFAVINHKLGDEKMWRKASILADAVHGLVSTKPESVTGQMLLDEVFLRSIGVTDFVKYRCDPNVEPPKMHEIGFNELNNIGRAKDRASL